MVRSFGQVTFAPARASVAVMPAQPFAHRSQRLQEFLLSHGFEEIHDSSGSLAVDIGDRKDDLARLLDAYLEEAAVNNLDGEVAFVLHAVGAVPTETNIAMMKRRILTAVAARR